MFYRTTAKKKKKKKKKKKVLACLVSTISAVLERFPVRRRGGRPSTGLQKTEASKQKTVNWRHTYAPNTQSTLAAIPGRISRSFFLQAGEAAHLVW
jgi:hypothetical protein